MHTTKKWFLYTKAVILPKFNKIFDAHVKKVIRLLKNCLKSQEYEQKDCIFLICTNYTNKCYNNDKIGHSKVCFKRMRGGVIMNEGKYDYKNICNYIIMKSNDDGNTITNLKLQKILYYVQGYFLKYFDYPAFSADIQAWQYGPVVPEAYYDYCSYGRKAIRVEPDLGCENYISDREDRKLINKIINKCYSISVSSLITKTHNEDPWKNTTRLRSVITTSDILDYFNDNDPLDIGRSI